jgi:hypothetical protein
MLAGRSQRKVESIDADSHRHGFAESCVDSLSGRARGVCIARGPLSKVSSDATGASLAHG